MAFTQAGYQFFAGIAGITGLLGGVSTGLQPGISGAFTGVQGSPGGAGGLTGAQGVAGATGIAPVASITGVADGTYSLGTGTSTNPAIVVKNGVIIGITVYS